MLFEEFQNNIKESIREYLGEKGKVEIKEVIKNNGIRLHGLIVLKEGCNVAPTIYLESFFEEYREGREYGKIVWDIIKFFEEEHPVRNMDMTFFMNYEIVKKGIMLKLVNREKNKEVLKLVPFVPFLDLAVIFYYSVVNEYIGNGSILIYREHLEKWQVDEESLYQDALENTKEKLGYEIENMKEVVEALLIEQIEEKKGTKEEQELELLLEKVEQTLNSMTANHMYVMTNRRKNLGAVCMIYQEHLHSFAEECGQNLFLLPSSIHEIILVTDNGREDAKQLEEMVKEVNSTQMEREDILSNHIYYYDRKTRETRILLP